MIVTKTPLRISLFGGGSDIAEFYKHNNGIVFSTTIDKYIYIAMNRCVADHLKIIYSELELVNDVEDIKHDRVREVLKHYYISSNIEICSFSDIPTVGTGLGSSSSFTVGLIKSLDPYIENNHLVKNACEIEIGKCGEPIGIQDQIAATYGGLNAIYFGSNGYDVVNWNLARYNNTRKKLEHRLMMFNTGIARKASLVLTEQVNKLKTGINIDLTKEMVHLTEQAINFYSYDKLDDLGNLLGEAWEIKKKLSSNISNSHIDEMYEIALKAGALGGKILGAGGGGYLLLYVPDAARVSVLNAMRNYDHLPFKFTEDGSTVEMQS